MFVPFKGCAAAKEILSVASHIYMWGCAPFCVSRIRGGLNSQFRPFFQTGLELECFSLDLEVTTVCEVNPSFKHLIRIYTGCFTFMSCFAASSHFALTLPLNHIFMTPSFRHMEEYHFYSSPATKCFKCTKCITHKSTETTSAVK